MADDKLTVFSVGNGDTILIEAHGKTILTDVHYRARVDDDDRIKVVGTWHSHPHGPKDFSDRDRATFASHRERDNEHGIATLVVVAAPEGLAGLMEV